VTTPTSPRRPRKDATANRAVILAAAADTISRDPHASLDTIARNAGLTRRALYGHFDDRDALVRETLRVGTARFNLIADRVDTAEPAPLALARMTAMLWHEAAHIQLAAALALDDAHVEETAQALAPLRQRLLMVVTAGQQRDELRTDIPAATLARLIEETARTVVARLDTTSPDAASLAVRAVLSIAGLGWRDAAALLTSQPELVELAQRGDGS